MSNQRIKEETMKIPYISNSKKIIVCAIVLVALALYGYFYWDTRNHIARTVAYALEEAIEKDFQEREYAELRSSSGNLKRKVKSVTVVTEKGEENIEFKDSIDERIAHRLAIQYMLVKIHPLHPDTLNFMLQGALRGHGFEIPTGIIYTHNRQTQYSANDSTALHRPYLLWTKKRTLDVKRTTAVQAWADINPWHILQHMHAGACWSLLLFVIVTSWAVITWNVDPYKVKFGKMIFDKEKRTLTIDGKECPLRNQEFQLLLMFVEEPDHTLSRNEIKAAFWKEEQGVDNRVSNLLSTLRKVLKDFPEYQVEGDAEDGYRFIYNEEAQNLA